MLPLANISPDPSDEYFADGLTEELIHALSRVSGLSVIARTSAMRYKGADRSIAEIGRELDIQTALEGSVRKAEGQVRITVQLVDTGTEDHIWSQVYDRDLEDIFAIQSDIARRVARALRVQIARRDKRALDRRATRVVDAYTLYLKGRYHWNLRTEDGFRQAISFFEEALEKDPTYARAYSGLADAYALLAWFEMMPPHDAFPRAREAAEEALRFDDHLAEAYASLGLVKFQYGWDWEGAEAAFHQALELDPGYPTAHHFYADYLKAMGRFEEALSEMARARELDPFSLPVHTGLGHVLYLARQYDRAIAQYR
ncbi:MAG: tetratricopeptide repeat protein, partial [Thermoplasmata archaeon]|nr:tetratricopeptide repeat protein [Thermoplasmata archaeon]